MKRIFLLTAFLSTLILATGVTEAFQWCCGPKPKVINIFDNNVLLLAVPYTPETQLSDCEKMVREQFSEQFEHEMYKDWNRTRISFIMKHDDSKLDSDNDFTKYCEAKSKGPIEITVRFSFGPIALGDEGNNIQYFDYDGKSILSITLPCSGLTFDQHTQAIKDAGWHKSRSCGPLTPWSSYTISKWSRNKNTTRF